MGDDHSTYSDIYFGAVKIQHGTSLYSFDIINGLCILHCIYGTLCTPNSTFDATTLETLHIFKCHTRFEF